MSGAIAAIATASSAAAANAAAFAGASSAVIEGVSTFAYTAATIGVTTGIAAGIGAAFAPKIPDPQALQFPLKQSMPVRQSAFGRVRVGGAYALYVTGSTHTNISYDVLALLDGQSQAVVSYYLNDDLMAKTSSGAYWWAPGAPGKYGGGGSNEPNLVKIDSRLGLATETAYAISSDVPVWTSAHRGDGVTSMLLQCTQAKREDQAADFPNGLPSPSAMIDAQLIYDPRDVTQTQGDRATYKFSDNPVLCLLAYLTDASGGMGLDYARFIEPAVDLWKAAADECDGVVSTSGMHATLLDAASAGDTKIFLADTTGLSPGTVISLPDGQNVTVSALATAGEVDLTGTLTNAHQAGELVYWSGFGQTARYRCAGVYKHDTPPGDVIKSILSTFDGWLGQRGDGALVVRTNTVYSPTVVLGDRHIVGYQVQHFLPDEQAVNQLIVSYTDPASAFNKAEAGYVQDDDDISARGEDRSQELYLQWVPSAPQALSVAQAVLNRSTQELRGTLTCNLAGLCALGERYIRVQISEIAAMNDVIVEVTGKPTIDVSSMTVSIPWVAATGATPPPASASPQRVQEQVARGGTSPTLTATLVSAPTEGNVLAAVGFGPAALPVNTADGWQLVDTHEGIVAYSGFDWLGGGGTQIIYGVLAWKRVVAGESAAQTPFTVAVSSDEIALGIIEISNCADLPGSLESLTWASPPSPADGSNALATASATTAADNDLAVAMGGWYYTYPNVDNFRLVSGDGWAFAEDGGDFSASYVGWQAVATAGTTVTATSEMDHDWYRVLTCLMVFSRNIRYALSPLGPPSGAPLQPLAAPTITSVTPVYPDSGGGVQGARLSIVVGDPGLTAVWKVQWKLSSDSVWTLDQGAADASGSPLTILSGLIPASGSIDVQVAYVTASQTSPWSATTTVTVAAAIPAGLVSSTSKSASFTTTAANSVYYVDTSAGPVTATLNATPAPDEIVEVWDSTGHAGTNPISLNGNGKTIAGAATVSNAVQINYGKIKLIYDGTQWLAS